MRILQDAETSIPLFSLPQIFTEKKKINKWYQSQKPTKFTRSVNSKYTQSQN